MPRHAGRRPNASGSSYDLLACGDSGSVAQSCLLRVEIQDSKASELIRSQSSARTSAGSVPNYSVGGGETMTKPDFDRRNSSPRHERLAAAAALADSELLSQLPALAATERTAIADLVA